MCELLVSHSYFNYAVNIGHLLTLYLDNKNVNVRKKVEETFIKIFKEDKKGTISLVVITLKYYSLIIIYLKYNFCNKYVFNINFFLLDYKTYQPTS